MEERIAQLEAQNQKLEALVRAQAELIEKLQAQLGKYSKNSHRPPSSDPPQVRSQRKRRKRSAKKPGGQPGHEGSHRQMLDSDDVDQIVECVPTECQVCHASLSGAHDSPRRHQVWELPPLQVDVTEYRLHTLECECCHHTQATLPKEVSWSAFGPRLHALCGLLRLDLRTSLERTQQFFAQVLDLQISKGAISAMEQRMSTRLEPLHGQLGDAVKHTAVKHCDETTWYLDGARRTLWTASNRQLSYMLISERRDTLSCKKLIGEQVQGTIITDRYSAYHYVDPSQRQMCWAHLLRDFEAISQSAHECESKAGELLESYTREMLKEYARARDGTELEWEVFANRWGKKQGVMHSFLCTCADASGKYAGMASEILKRKQSLWTFLSNREVEPTNNLAERTLRHAVMLRKTSYGSRSERGMRYIERGLSVRQTLLNQGRSLFHFLYALCSGAPQPLLPTP
jgi:transposase